MNEKPERTRNWPARLQKPFLTKLAKACADVLTNAPTDELERGKKTMEELELEVVIDTTARYPRGIPWGYRLEKGEGWERRLVYAKKMLDFLYVKGYSDICYADIRKLRKSISVRTRVIEQKAQVVLDNIEKSQYNDEIQDEGGE